jgi:hypothetical protein
LIDSTHIVEPQGIGYWQQPKLLPKFEDLTHNLVGSTIVAFHNKEQLHVSIQKSLGIGWLLRQFEQVFIEVLNLCESTPKTSHAFCHSYHPLPLFFIQVMVFSHTMFSMTTKLVIYEIINFKISFCVMLAKMMWKTTIGYTRWWIKNPSFM